MSCLPKSRLRAGEVSQQSLFPLVGARVICPQCGMANGECAACADRAQVADMIDQTCMVAREHLNFVIVC